MGTGRRAGLWAGLGGGGPGGPGRSRPLAHSLGTSTGPGAGPAAGHRPAACGVRRLVQCQGTTQPASGGRGHLGRSRFLPGAGPWPASGTHSSPALPVAPRCWWTPSGTLVPPTGLEDDPQAVLQTIRRYVHVFFGCKECGEHFEEMAKESIDSVKTPDQAILWLWKKHNLVNSRLAGEQKPLGGPSLRGACVWVAGACLSFTPRRGVAGPRLGRLSDQVSVS